MFFMIKVANILIIGNAIPSSHKKYSKRSVFMIIVTIKPVTFYLPLTNLKVKDAITWQVLFGVKYRKKIFI